MTSMLRSVPKCLAKVDLPAPPEPITRTFFMRFLDWAQAMSVQEFAPHQHWASTPCGVTATHSSKVSIRSPGVGPGAGSPRELVTPVALPPTAVPQSGCEYAPRLEPLLVRREAP